MQKQSNSRRQIIKGAVFGATGLIGASSISELLTAQANPADVSNDIKILNGALFYEHQAIWAYGFAAGKLTQTDVGKAVLALALANQADHKNHRDTLSKVIKSLGGNPVTAQADYLTTVTPYIQNGDGKLDSDVNIAKLALALEVDAAIAYGREVAKLKTPALITAGASIGSTESAHATAIRYTFKTLGVDLKIIPASFVNADTRKDWILKV